MVVIAINPLNTQTLRMTLTLVLTDFVLLARPYIGVKIKDGGAHVMLKQPLNNG